MFGDLLKNLLQKQVQSSIQDKLGGTGASILGGLFGGDFGNLLGADKNPLQDLFGDKWQNGGPQEPQWMDMFHRGGMNGGQGGPLQNMFKGWG